MNRAYDFKEANEEIKIEIGDSIANIKDQIDIIKENLTEEQSEILENELTTIDSELEEIESKVKSANDDAFNFLEDFLKFVVQIDNYGDDKKKALLVEKIANANDIHDLPTCDLDLI